MTPAWRFGSSRSSICSMPTAERRAKQKRARQRDAAAAAAAEAAMTSARSEATNRDGDEPTKDKIPLMATLGDHPKESKMRSVATQTKLNEKVVQTMIEQYWRLIDSKGVDQAQLAVQFMINTTSGGLKSSAAAWQHLFEKDGGGEQGEKNARLATTMRTMKGVCLLLLAAKL